MGEGDSREKSLEGEQPHHRAVRALHGLLGGQALTGRRHEAEERRQHGAPAPSLGAYVRSGSFWESTAENWQSEFMSVGALVVLGIWLRQRGSPESKPVDAPHLVNE